MSKFVYCSQCGTRLPRYRKAIKEIPTIIEMIDPHVCPDEPVPLDLGPSEMIEFVEPSGKFAESLKDMKARGVPGQISTADLRDRRSKPDVKSSAPLSVLDQLKSMNPSVSANSLEDIPEGD